jgi:hypothetical protein
MQILKFAGMRASSDPDRDTNTHGIYYGNNIPGVYVPGSYLRRMRTTRGAWRKRGDK